MANFVNIMAALFFIIASWWGLQALNLHHFFKRPNQPQAKVLLILLSIVIGSAVARFFTEYLSWFTSLRDSLT